MWTFLSLATLAVARLRAGYQTITIDDLGIPSCGLIAAHALITADIQC